MQEDIKNAIDVLQKGGIILYPTDTIWGIGCDATNNDAVKRIFEIKKRTDAKAMLVLVDNPSKIESYVKEVPNLAWDLIELATKPLTIIYPNAKNLAPGIIAEDNSIGIRVTNEVFTKKLISRFRKPIVSTSANISGRNSPQCFNDISNEIIDAVDYVVKYRQKEQTNTQASSIIKLGVGNIIEIIRE